MVLQKGRKAVKNERENSIVHGSRAKDGHNISRGSGHTVEEVRELCKKTVSKIYQLHPLKVKQFYAFVETCCTSDLCQAALEGIVMGTKSPFFSRGCSSWHFLVTCRVLTRAIVLYCRQSRSNNSEKTQVLTEKQVNVFVSTYESLITSCLNQRTANQDFYFKCIRCLKENFVASSEIFQKCNESSSNGAEIKSLGQFCIYLSVIDFDCEKDIKSENQSSTINMNTCSKTIGVLCSSGILTNQKSLAQYVTSFYDYDSFISLLWPELKRALTRHAEKALNSVSTVMKSVKLDLSEKLLDFFDIFFDFFTSLNPEISEETQQMFQIVFRNCSQWEFIAKLAEMICSIFAGKHEKKLNTPAQKQGILACLRFVANNAVPDSKQDQLSGTCLGYLTKLIKPNDPPATTHSILQTVLTWSQNFNKRIDGDFISWLKAPTCNQANPISQSYLAKICLKLLEKPRFEETVRDVSAGRNEYLLKLQGQNTTANSLVDLGPNLLLCAKLLDNEYEKFQRVLSGFLDKFSLLVSSRTLKLDGLNMKEIILLLKFALIQLNDIFKPFESHFSVLAVFALHSDYEVRKTALQALKTVASLYDPESVSRAINWTISQIWNENYDESTSTFMSKEYVSDINTVPKIKQKGRIMFDLLLACVTSNWAGNDAKSLSAELLRICCSDELRSTGKTWKGLCDACKIPKTEQSQIVLDHMMSLNDVRDFDTAVLESSAINYGNDFVSPILHRLLKDLKISGNIEITMQDYEIFQTPEGKLWDKSVWVDVSRIDQESKNFKREDKGMHWKEEKAFQELAKELRKETKLTKKQQELVDNALAKEAQIRMRVTDFEKRINHIYACLLALVNGCPQVSTKESSVILSGLCDLISNPACTTSTLDTINTIGCHILKETQNPLYYKWNFMCQCMGKVCKAPFIKNQLKGITDDLSAIEQISENLKSLVFIYVDDAVHTKPLPLSVFNLFYSALHQGIYNLTVDLETSSGEKYDIIESIIAIYDVQLSCSSSARYELSPVARMFNSLFHVLQEFPPSIQVKAKQVSHKLCLLVRESGKLDPQLSFHLYQSLLNSSSTVRSSALDSCELLVHLLMGAANDQRIAKKIFALIYALCFVEDDTISSLCVKIVSSISASRFEDTLPDSLLELVCTGDTDLNQAASNAVGRILESKPSNASTLFDSLINLFEVKKTFVPAKKDTLGRLLSEEVPDISKPRLGIAACLKVTLKAMSATEIDTIFDFLFRSGLNDHNEEVRQGVLQAAMEFLDIYGKSNFQQLLKLLQNYMDSEQGENVVKQSVVILMGSLARYLMESDPTRIKPIVSKLMESLSEPSPLVQEAVANCLPKLVDAIREDCPDLISKLMNLLLTTDKPDERRGAAFGVAGLVKGLGIMTLKQLNVMTQLQEAIEDKKSINRRVGALLGFQTLCLLLGRIFEPYLVTLLPHLLISFGDPQRQVRDMAEETSKVVMQKLTVHGVKIVLPTLLKGLEEESWRTKVGCIELLGAMSHCAPKQLSACLPTIVPRLLEVLNDSHHKVESSALQALKQVGSVVKNPEVKEISPSLLMALSHSNDNTKKTLEILLKTRFVHMIDAASLSLIMPILENSFKDRSAEVRKIACQILCNINTLTDQKDLLPYLSKLIPGFKIVLVDPVPEIRSHASKALGAMVRGMGETILEVMMPWLLQTVISNVSNIDRAGAAQGLSEVYAAVGPSKLAEVLPQFVYEAMNVNQPPHVRDGYLSVFIYLPLSFGSHFASYIDQIIPAILQGLASEVEYVRESAFKAGQQIINQYSTSSLAIFLPELDKGLFDENWRIRFSSVQLLGDLLFKLLGVTGKMSTETEGDDDTFGTEKTSGKLTDLLTVERRDRVLGGLYMGRNDVSLPVRQASLHVWKIVVSNTPRTLREILPTLFSLLLGNLACECEEKKQIAARTLGDLAKKLGDRVLPEIIPVLEAGLKSPDTDHRQGVCIGLGEVMASTSRDQVQHYLSIIVPTVEKGLCDPFERVRKAAAKAFDKLYNIIYQQALQEVLKPLIPKLTDETIGEYATDGLKQVIAVRSKSVMPFLIPQLTKPPANVAALAIIAPVAGETLNSHLENILPALVLSLSRSETETDDLEGMIILLKQINEQRAISYIVEYLLSEAIEEKNSEKSLAALKLFKSFVTNTDANLSDYASDTFKNLLILLADTKAEQSTLLITYESLTVFVKKIEPPEQIAQLFNLRQAIRQASNICPTNTIPGLSIPKKGLAAVLPIFRESILNGSQESKEQAAFGLSETIKVTTAEALQHSVIHITGPLIRILGERYSVNVRVAFLSTLNLLLNKVGAMLKPFLPQLQNTFMKAISDANDRVKMKGADGIGLIMTIHQRPDPIFTELSNLAQNKSDASAQSVALSALQKSIEAVGAKINPTIRDKLFSDLMAIRENDSEDFRRTCGGCLGTLSGLLPENKFQELMKDVFLDMAETRGIDYCHTNAVALATACKFHAKIVCGHKDAAKVLSIIRGLCSSKNSLLSQAGYS